MRELVTAAFEKAVQISSGRGNIGRRDVAAASLRVRHLRVARRHQRQNQQRRLRFCLSPQQRPFVQKRHSGLPWQGRLCLRRSDWTPGRHAFSLPAEICHTSPSLSQGMHVRRLRLVSSQYGLRRVSCLPSRHCRQSLHALESASVNTSTINDFHSHTQYNLFRSHTVVSEAQPLQLVPCGEA